MLFSMRQLGTRFADALSKWLTVSSELETVCFLIFAGEYDSSPYLEHTFLALAQAAESYHRIRIGGTALPPDEHAKRLDLVSNAAPANLRDWTRRMLRYSNEVTFRRRMRELVERADTMMDFVGDREGFVDKVTNTRNYLVHRTDELRERAATGVASYYLTQALRYMLKASLVLDVGFPEDEVTRLYGENQDFIQFRARYSRGIAGA
jgi:hypothetical protein